MKKIFLYLFFLVILPMGILFIPDATALQPDSIVVLNAQAPAPAPEDIVLALTPLIVYLVTLLITKALPDLSGWVVTGVIVPVLSLLVTWLSQLVVADYGFWPQVALGLVAVFINEAIKQFQQGSSA